MNRDYRAMAAAGASVLQRWYSPRRGTWRGTGWWNSANALTAVIRYTGHTGDRAHLGVIDRTYRRAGRRQAGGRPGSFVNEFFDDNGWWALAWVDAYDLTGDGRYLDVARSIFTHNLGGWDGTCGGGLWWSDSRTYKNAVTNELFLTLAARLHQRVPGDREYLDWALRSWHWLDASGMIGPGGLVHDGLSSACASNYGTTWTYNQGVVLGGLVALRDITGDDGYLRRGEAIADAALATLAGPAGILAEPCEPAGCDGDQTQFKGIFIRYLHDLWRCGAQPAYAAFITANADALWDRARNRSGQFGLCWAGPFDQADASRQSSALDALTAAASVSGG